MNSELEYEKRHHLVREIVETAAITLLIFLAIRFAVQNFNVDGTSMEPGLHTTELILVDKWTYLFHPPARGDVVVFAAPPDPSQDYVKRIIGIPGDTITIRGTAVSVDGIPLHETYVAARNQGTPPGAHAVIRQIVPTNDYFVLGDNRAVSSDSRIWGFVPRQNIIGRAALVYWPLMANNSGFLPNVAPIFANIHQHTTQNNSLLSIVTANLNILSLFLIATLLLAYSQHKTLWRWLKPAAREPSERRP